MKLAYKTTESFLKSPDAQHRACLVYGPDAGLVRERVQLIKEALLGKDADGFASAELDYARLLEDPALLADELRTVHMLSPKRVILVRGATDKLTSIVEGAQEFFNESAFLIVMAGELPARSSLRKWFEDSGQVAALACYHDEARDVRQLVQQTLAGAGIKVSGEVVDYLADQLGNDRYVTRQELEKVILYAGGAKTLEIDAIRKLVDFNRDTEMDDIVFSIANRDLKSLEATIRIQLQQNTSPVSYLRTIQRYFYRLYQVKLELAKGMDAETAINILKPKVFYRHAPIMARHAKTWQLDQLVTALFQLIEAEKACKTSDMPIEAVSSRKLFQITQIR